MSIQDEIPGSRLTLTYKTEVNGAQQDIDLPLRLAVSVISPGGHQKTARWIWMNAAYVI